MVVAKGQPFKVVLTADQQAAIQNASYVITQLRVGQMPARVADEYLGLRHGLIGQETTGVGGMAKALRTIPVVLQIAADMRELARPEALLANFTNPAGLVTQALQKYAPDVPSVGVCNVAITTKMEIIESLEGLKGSSDDPRADGAEYAGVEPPVLAPRVHRGRGRRVAAGDRRLLWLSCVQTLSRNGTLAPSRCWGCCPIITCSISTIPTAS